MSKNNLDIINESHGFILWKSANSWQNYLKKQLADLNISPLELILLSSLYWLIVNKGEVMQEHIAKHANVGKMTVSKTLRQLEKKRFINRKEHEVDTRAKSISINNSGMHILKKAMQIIERVDENFFSSLKNKINVFTEMMKSLDVR